MDIYILLGNFRRPSVLYSLINSLVSKFYFLKVGELFIGD